MPSSAAMLCALESIWRGDFRPADQLERELGPDAAAWRMVFAAHRRLAGLDHAPAGASELARLPLGDEAGREAAAAACVPMLRAALLSFDRDGVERIAAVHEEATRRRDDPWSRASRLWYRALLGDSQVLEDATSLSTTARSVPAPLVIELTALRALAAAEVDVEMATTLARRASRMARTEAMPQEEYLASLVLARVRRLSGRAHLASRIASALARVVPAAWRRWVDWELAFSGTLDGSSAEDAVAGALLRAVLGAAALGQRDAMDAHVAALVQRCEGFADLGRDVSALVACVDPRATVDPSSEAAAWILGGGGEAPRGLSGVCAAVAPDGETGAAEAWVVAPVGGGARRVLRPGLGLAGPLEVVTQSQRKKRRVERCGAVLALAGARGMTDEELFCASFGFEYDPVIHASAFRVLLHRVRERLDGVATLERAGRQSRLVAHAPFAIADPRTATPIATRLLGLVAARPGASAKELALALGAPLRTVQTALGSLVSDGACEARRDSRQIGYWVEDTTFSSPTVEGWPPATTGE